MNTDRTFLDRFEPHFKCITDELEKLLRSPVEIATDIIAHALLGQGKRLRPLLFVLSAQLCGYEGEDVYRLSTVFECIHTGSLLHDDVLDNAETRRKKPAAREVWGNQASVLGGDYLYSKAIEIALATGNQQLLRVLNETSIEMVEGQFLELVHTDNWRISKEEYLSIIISKTAVLMSAACGCGAIVAGAKEEVVNRLKEFGRNLGIAFQLIDDLLDYTSREEEFGKPVGKDLKEGKITLPLIYTLSERDEAEIEDMAKPFIDRKATENDHDGIITLVRKGGAIEDIRAEAWDYVAEAADYLGDFQESQVKSDLLALNEYIVERHF